MCTQMAWNSMRLSKFDGKEFKRFIDEPYTADSWWEVQVCIKVWFYENDVLKFYQQSRIPQGANLLSLILYSDKTKLSSFGKVVL